MYNTLGGVYSIVCQDTGFSYIGSSVDMWLRLKTHYSKLELGKHQNQRLQFDFTKYGRASFLPHFLEYIDDSYELLKREYIWINQTEKCYNIHRGFNQFPILTEKEKEAFWRYVDKTKDCWEWNADEKNRYPRFYLGRLKKRWQAHRIAYCIEYGRYDEACVVCHKCDNKRCVRPDHLYLGSNQDNMKDRASKGLGCKLSDDDANKIRQLYLTSGVQKSAELQKMIKDQYGFELSQVNINAILRNKVHRDENWKPNWTTKIRRCQSGENATTCKINWEIVRYIRSKYNHKNLKQLVQEVKDKFGIQITKSTISCVGLNQIWKENKTT